VVVGDGEFPVGNIEGTRVELVGLLVDGPFVGAFDGRFDGLKNSEISLRVLL
jgi:hypothetical protein